MEQGGCNHENFACFKEAPAHFVAVLLASASPATQPVPAPHPRPRLTSGVKAPTELDASCVHCHIHSSDGTWSSRPRPSVIRAIVSGDMRCRAACMLNTAMIWRRLGRGGSWLRFQASDFA